MGSNRTGHDRVRDIEALRIAVWLEREVVARYPASVFPEDSQSRDAQSAATLRDMLPRIAKRISSGCQNCYAERIAARFSGPGQPFEGLARRTTDGPRWTGSLRLVPERLEDPLHWRKPRRIFVNSMSDLFHDRLIGGEIAGVFGVMIKAFWHTFQVLTKRPERAMAWLSTSKNSTAAYREAQRHEWPAWAMDDVNRGGAADVGWPPRNVWLGVSVENQAAAEERVPLLLQAPAAVRFLSVEPLLGPVDLSPWLSGGIDWVIVGAESGPGARPMNENWVRSLRDQCSTAAGVALFYKQAAVGRTVVSLPLLDGRKWAQFPGEARG